tara:strand:- start:6991 stop:8913 length:1923 start_codon:yes stop_codon:yes gene_type:complete
MYDNVPYTDYSSVEKATQIFAVCPWLIGGLVLKIPEVDDKNKWLAYLRGLIDEATEVRGIPSAFTEENLYGGWSFFEYFKTGQLSFNPGMFANKNRHQVLTLNITGNLSDSQVKIFGEICNELDYSSQNVCNSILRRTKNAIILFDNFSSFDTSYSNSEFLPDNLLDRISLLPIVERQSLNFLYDTNFEEIKKKIGQAREKLKKIKVNKDLIRSFTKIGAGFSIYSLRQINFAIHVARINASLNNSTKVEERDISVAVQLVFLQRAKSIPKTNEKNEADQEKTSNDLNESNDKTSSEKLSDDFNTHNKGNLESEQAEKKAEMELNGVEGKDSSEDQSNNATNNLSNRKDEKNIEKMSVRLPQNLIDELNSKIKSKISTSVNIVAGKSKTKLNGLRHGRSFGSKIGRPNSVEKIRILETIKAALPFQKERSAFNYGSRKHQIRIFPEDFRIARKKYSPKVTTIFLVDASGSSAAHRLGEAKGAVELLLSNCYVRRDEVAMIMFKGSITQLVLPPTRSLVRAKKTLVGLVGGGGTPLVLALEHAFNLALSLLVNGRVPNIVVLSDGGANVTREGVGGREKAFAQSIEAGQLIAKKKIKSFFIDTSVRASQRSEMIAKSMDAKYFLLPSADSDKIVKAISLKS